MTYRVPLILLWACLAAPAALAQTAPAPTAATRGPGRLSGVVVDAATKKPVEFATVALLPTEGDKPLTGAAADAQGRFTLTDLPIGAFRLSLSFVGYAPRIVPVTVTQDAVDLGTVELTAATKQLGEVQVTGEREIVENRPDRLVYNAERDATNTGGTAADVLRKTPLLSVDADGNVSLRGAANPRILINNKPSALLSGNLADALKQIPADQIKAVEVLTAPSAKYDGEGSGGVINIVLKKNNLRGVNGSVGGGGGNRNQGLNGAINARSGKLGANASLSLNHNRYPYRSRTERTDYLPDGQVGRLQQRMQSNAQGRSGWGQAGLTFDPSPEHGFQLTFNGNAYHSQQPQRFYNQYSGGGRQRDTLYSRANDQSYLGQNFDLSGGYTRTFKEHEGREWTVLAQHSRNRGDQDYDLDQYDAADVYMGPLEYRERSRNNSLNRETTLQTDYVHPFKEGVSLETGAKVIRRNVGSDYSIDTLLVSRQADFARSPLRSNAFDYQQDVAAAYGTYNFGLGKKYTFSLGTRLEYTNIKGEFQGDNGRFTNDYTNLLPSLSATRNLKQPGQTLRLSYSRRIQRPGIWYLNPFVRQADPRNISYGNPELNPEVTDNYELAYSTFGKFGSVNAAAYTRRTGNAIEEINFYNAELARAESTYRNIARNSSYGLSLNTNLKPLPKWQVGVNLDGSYSRLRSVALNRTTTRLQFDGGLNSSWSFGKGYTVQGYGGFWTGGVGLQTRYGGGGYYSLGLKRTILKEKLDLTLNASNFLQTYRVFRARTVTPQFESSSAYYNAQSSVRLSLSYRFGKVDSGGPQRQRRSISNDDQKGGGSKGGGN